MKFLTILAIMVGLSNASPYIRSAAISSLKNTTSDALATTTEGGITPVTLSQCNKWPPYPKFDRPDYCKDMLCKKPCHPAALIFTLGAACFICIGHFDECHYDFKGDYEEAWQEKLDGQHCTRLQHSSTVLTRVMLGASMMKTSLAKEELTEKPDYMVSGNNAGLPRVDPGAVAIASASFDAKSHHDGSA